ncbi:unnamed protein product [Rhizoctonia solani]|uniref:E2 ubiquitin-conjugating enzyme n=1 Tax=Rhizoctonia solani TaxID=456999 RepID=A0A8H3E476_9AGAM|nr:unnamed protein product [Rhizoctonia solani]
MALPKRIIKETERLAADPAPGISASPHEDNLRYFDVTIAGPGGSPFEGGVFKLELFLPEEYPMNPPKVRFLTKIYHPNIDKLGRICLDILKDKWSPALQIRTVLLSIQALLSAPNPDDPLATDVAKHYKENESDAIRTMSGSTAAPFYSLAYTSAMNSHLVDSSYSSGDNNTYLTGSMGAGPSTQPSGNVNGESTPGSTKRPFPWASSESERDKRPRSGSGTAAGTDDAEETMSTDESAYTSAAESPNPHFSRSPTRVDWPLSVVDESNRAAATSAPRIPTPAALRSSSPLRLPNLPLASQSGFRPVSPPTTTTSNPLRLALSSRPTSSYTNNVTEQPRTQPLDLGWLTQQLDEALPPPRDRAFSLSFGSASVDSALPHPQHSRAGSTRVPLPWVDIEGDSSLLGPESESLATSLGQSALGDSASSPGVASTIRSDHSPPSTTNHSPPATITTRRPLSLNLRNFPLVSGPDSPSSAFPTSASPRTSAFDLAVTPPGSALPSFVARMMEVDSPVHGGGDSYVSSQAETYIPSTDRTETYIPAPSLSPAAQSETYIPSTSQSDTYVPSQPQAETYASSPLEVDNGDASLSALRQFMHRDQANGEFVHQEGGSGFGRRGSASGFTHHNQGNGLAQQNRGDGFAHQNGASGFTQEQSAGLLRQNQLESSSSSPNQAPMGMAVGSYFPAPESHGARRVPLSMGGRFEPPRNGHEQSRNGHDQVSNPQTEQVARNGHELPAQPPRVSHAEQPRNNHEQGHPSEASATDTMGSIYSRRLTESGISFPSRPSDSGSSLPSFRATVSPEPGRMSWSDLFGPRTPETPSTRDSEVATSTRGSEVMSTRSDATTSMRASEISLGTRTSDATMATRTTDAMMGRMSDVSMGAGVSDATTGMRTSEAGMSTGMSARMDGRGADVGRAGVRSALARAVRLPEGPPRLHLDALPREDRTSATNLSRTPPGPDSHPAVWFEDSGARPRRTSSTRWTDLFPEPAAAPVPIVPRPTQRARMPPPVSMSSTDTVFDPLTGMSWNRNSQAVPDPPSTTYDAADSLARYQTFAQSIDEIRRSPPPPQQSAPLESAGWAGTGSNRSSWAFPRHEPPQYEQPPTDGNWLREWESERDRRSREARQDYIRRRDTDYTSHDRRHNAEYGTNDEAPRPPPVAQLNDTQAVWPDIMGRPRPRPRPMTRASLVATGFADSDLWTEGDGSNNRLWGEIPRPSRRAELLPARTNEVDTPMQFLPSAHEGGMFTESPPSLLEDFNDSGPYSEPISGIAQPSRPDPVSFRSASRVLRASLADTSRRGSDGPRAVPPEPEQPRVPSRDRWESQLSRSQVQLERVRQLLHRSNDSRDREVPRRHPPDPPTQPHRRSFLPVLDNEIPSSTISSDSRRSSMSGVAWPRPAATEAPPPRPFSLHEGDHPEWSSPDVSSRNNTLTHELARASSLRGRRRTLLPESASRRDSTGFLHSMNNALSQVESHLLHINRELNALADEGNGHNRRYGPQNESEVVRPRTPPRTGPHMDWAFEPAQRNPTPPPTLPPFEFAPTQRNSGWPAERYTHLSGETSSLGLELPVEYPGHRAPTRGPEGYYEQRQGVRDPSSTRGTRATSYAHEAWRSGGQSNEWWPNDASSPNLPTHMPLRDRILFRPSGSSHQSGAATRQPEPANSRSNSMGSSMQAQPTSATFGRLHRRRLSPPAPPHQPSVSSSLLRPFANQNSSTSPTRSYTSRFSHFLPRRSSGRGGGGSSDDNDEWHPTEQATRRFFLRPRGRARPAPPNGDYLRDDEFDDSYEGLLRLAARIGDAKPRDDYAPDDIVTVVKRCSHWFHRECVQVSSEFPVCIRIKTDRFVRATAMVK